MKIQILTFVLTFIFFQNEILCQVGNQNDTAVFVDNRNDSLKLDSQYYYHQKYGDYILIRNKFGQGLIDTNLNVILDPIIRGYLRLKPDGIIVTHDNKRGLYNYEGKELLPPIYHAISFENDRKYYRVTYKDESIDDIYNNTKYGIYKIGFGFQIEPIFSQLNYLSFVYFNLKSFVITKFELEFCF